MKPIATWNLIDDAIRWNCKPRMSRAAIWRIEMWVKRGQEKSTREIIPSEPVTLRAMLENVLHTQIDELLAELPGPDNMGFSVFLWR